MAEQKNKSAEQLLSDLHQKRLEQALNEFNADKTRMAVGRLLEEYVDDGGQSYFDGAQKDATLYFVDDDYMDKVSDVEPKDEDKPKKEKKGGFFAGALSKLAEKMKTEEPDDYEDEFPDEIEEYKDDKEDDVNLIDGTNKGFDMPAPEDLEPIAPIEEEEAVPPVKPSIFDTAKLSSMDLNDIEERLEKVHLKPATMEFADPDDVLKEILGETEEEEKKEEPKEEIKPVKKENRKIHKKKDSLDDISVDDIGLGNIVNKIAEEEELKNKEEKPEETSNIEEVETEDNTEVSADTSTEEKTEDVQEIEEPETVNETVEEEPVQEATTDEVEETPEVEDVASEDTEPVGESTITVTSVPEESINNVADEMEEQENHTQEDYPTKFKEKNDNKNTYVAEKTVILDKPLIDASEVISDDNLTATEDNEAEETQPVSQEDNDMTKEEEVLNAITTETEAEVEEDVIPSRRRRFIEEKKKGKKKPEEPVEEEIDDEDLEEDEYEDDFDDTEDKPKKGLFGLFKKKKKEDEEDDDDFEDDDEEIEENDEEAEDKSEHNDKTEDYDKDEDLDEEDDDEDYDDFDDEYRKGSGLKKFFIGALFVILVVAVTALAAMCYSYKLQLDSTREQLNKMAGNNTEETTAIVEDITSEITTQATTVATTEAVTESATTAVVSSGNNNTQAVQIVNSDGTSSNLTGATASGTTYTVKSGDTGEKICKSVYGEYTKENWSKILKANNMNESSTYHPGQELIIP